MPLESALTLCYPTNYMGKSPYGKLTDAQLVKKSLPAFVETQGSVPCTYFSKVHFNNILPSTIWSSKFSSFQFFRAELFMHFIFLPLNFH